METGLVLLTQPDRPTSKNIGCFRGESGLKLQARSLFVVFDSKSNSLFVVFNRKFNLLFVVSNSNKYLLAFT